MTWLDVALAMMSEPGDPEASNVIGGSPRTLMSGTTAEESGVTELLMESAAECPLQIGEACDDGNAVDGDGCDTNCTITACGNGILALEEQCDERGQTPTCDSNCTFVQCGDNTLNLAAGERCDDGNFSNGDGCDSSCTVE